MIYILKIWLSTVIVSPLLIYLLLFIFEGSQSFDVYLMIYMIIIGAVFSIPVVLIQLAFLLSALKVTSIKTIKIGLNIIGILSAFILLNISSDELLAPFIYSILVTASIWLFKLKENNRTV